METTVSDANATSDVLNADAGLSSSPDGISIQAPASARAVSTVEGDADKGAKGDAAGKADADKIAAEAAGKKDGQDDKHGEEDEDGEGADKGKATGEKGQKGRYDQDPDWQRMKQERDEAVLKAARLEGAMDAIKEGKGNAETAGEKGATVEPIIPFKDITKMSNEELIDWFERDPQGYEANKFAQFLHEARIILAQRESVATQGKVQKEAITAFAKNNPDFDNLMKDGSIAKFIKENPGHNMFSAYRELTLDTRIQSAVDAAVKKAVQETEERMTKNFKAKRTATTAGEAGGGGGNKPAGDERLKDTKKSGGAVAVLAERLRASRERKAGTG
ncbi:MAG: hypothetical protein LLG06_19750 [Desulfobacteraceae bacterium]|nr:hypothetical protein [Desulfobacteraceae bacterium]